jgi:hypothetical protein
LGVDAFITGEEIPGHLVYYSLTGQPNSWLPIPSLSLDPNPGKKRATITLATPWVAGAKLYVLWADDNGLPSPDTAYEIDNFAIHVSDGLPKPLTWIRSSQVEICWIGGLSTNYQVQYRSELTTNSWVPLVDCVPGNGATNCIYDPVSIGLPQRFYRVVVTNCVSF